MEEYFGFKFEPTYYYYEHVWAKVETDGNVRVGFDDVVARGSHDVFLIKADLLKTVVKQKKKMGVIESTKYTGPITAPISGTIVEVNQDVRKNAGKAIADDPYGVGWIAVLKPSNLYEDLKTILYGEKAVEWFKTEAQKVQFELEASKKFNKH